MTVLVALLIWPLGVVHASRSADAQRPAYLRASSVPGAMHRRVNVGGYRLYVECVGAGSPTVVFDNEAYLDVWRIVQQKVGGYTRACAYDRAGMGLSDLGPEPVTSAQLLRDLRRLLIRGNIPGPYILVGDAFGGTTVRLYASRYRASLAGLVLVDAIPPELMSHTTVFPYYDVDVRASRAQARSMTSLGKLPLVVLSHRIQLTLPQNIEQRWPRYQRQLARLSSNSVYALGTTSGYAGMPLQQPMLVVEAIVQVLLAYRSPSHALLPCGFDYLVHGAECM